MKNATEWLNQVGEAVMFSAFAGSNPPGNEVERLVRQIQADALWHAAKLVNDLSRGTKSEDRAIAIDEARDLIAAEAEGVTAQPNDPGSATRP